MLLFSLSTLYILVLYPWPSMFSGILIPQDLTWVATRTKTSELISRRNLKTQKFARKDSIEVTVLSSI
jgi:hypothetical protein